jgi:hypothetical protein
MARRKGPAHLAFAQNGIAGTVRDSQGGVLPGVTVAASSRQLIENVRSRVTVGHGRLIPLISYATVGITRFGQSRRRSRVGFAVAGSVSRLVPALLQQR